jgi:hypothetical protein
MENSSFRKGMKNKGSCPMHVERHMLLISCREVCPNDSLDVMSDEEIQSAIHEKFVSGAYRLIGRRGIAPFPLGIIFLAFEVPFLHASLHDGHERVPVGPYVLKPMRC